PTIPWFQKPRGHFVHDQRVSICLLVENHNIAWMGAGIHWKVSNGRCATEFRNIIVKSEDPKLTIPGRRQPAEIKMANCPPGRMQAKKRIASCEVTQPR